MTVSLFYYLLQTALPEYTSVGACPHQTRHRSESGNRKVLNFHPLQMIQHHQYYPKASMIIFFCIKIQVQNIKMSEFNFE